MTRNTRLTRSDVVRELQYAQHNGIVANFRGANLTGVDLSAMFTEDENLSGFINADFSGADLSNANMSYNVFKHVDFTDANLNGVVAHKIHIHSNVTFDHNNLLPVEAPL